MTAATEQLAHEMVQLDARIREAAQVHEWETVYGLEETRDDVCYARSQLLRQHWREQREWARCGRCDAKLTRIQQQLGGQFCSQRCYGDTLIGKPPARMMPRPLGQEQEQR